LAGHNHAAGSEPVLEGIAAGRGFAVSTARSGGPGSFLSLRLAAERGLIRWVGPEARAGMDASAQGHHLGLIFRTELVEEVGIGSEGDFRSGDPGGCGHTVLAIFQFFSATFGGATLVAEFAASHDPIARGERSRGRQIWM